MPVVENKSGAVADINYSYNLTDGAPKKIGDILKVDIPEDSADYINRGLNDSEVVDYSTGHFGRVFNTDERMGASTDTERFRAYTGSVLQMIGDLSNKPFNEYFFTHEEGMATFHYRVTPFDEQDWFSLPYIEIFDSDILNTTLSRSDQEQYSVFKLNSPEATKGAGSGQMVLPITDDMNELMSRYIYKTMDVTSLYFDNVADDSNDSEHVSNADKAANKAGGDQTNNETAAKFYPSWNAVITYPQVDRKLTDADRVRIADKYQIDSHYGGQRLYDIVGQIANDPTKNMQDRVQAIMDRSNAYCQSVGIPNPINSVSASKLVQDAMAQKYNKYNYIMAVLPPQERPFVSTQGIGGTLTGQLTHMLATEADRKAHPNLAARDIVILSQGRIGSEQAREIVDSWNKNGTLTKAEYDRIMNTVSHSAINNAVVGGKGTVDNISATYRMYELKLFNWYADNSKFHSGDIEVIGRFDVEIGKRLYMHQPREANKLWEFYIESVSHSFDYQNGWTTTIGVTRGLPVEYIGDRQRFQMFWGHGADFEGGFLGEPTIQEVLASLGSKGGDDGDSTGSNLPGSKIAMKAVALAKKYVEHDGENTSIYSMAAHGNDFIASGKPYRTDCSGFVYYIFKHAGLNWGSGVLTTWGIAASPKVTTVGNSGSNKDSVWNKMHKGDIVFWNGDGHVGIYIGNGQCIAMNGNGGTDNSASAGIKKFAAGPGSYWWGNFSGHVVRVK